MLDIEQPEQLLVYLRSTGRLSTQENPRLTVLSGGVSSRTVLVDSPNHAAFVIKQALPKLRVASEWHSDPKRSQREALGLTWLAKVTPPGTIMPLLFADSTQHLLAMQAAPWPHENWKSCLLAGKLNPSHFEQFGQLLGMIHRGSDTMPLPPEFEDRSFFLTLRVEPYYQFTAEHLSDARPFLTRLIEETLKTRLAVVHADYSPKNILLYRNNLILLDHEVIHFGDPTFDLGFALTHLLSKGHHLPAWREQFLAGAELFWQSYRSHADTLLTTPGFEARAVRHTLACLLARVRGRSPLEYLSDPEKNRQLEIVLRFLPDPPATIPELIGMFGQDLAKSS